MLVCRIGFNVRYVNHSALQDRSACDGPGGARREYPMRFLKGFGGMPIPIVPAQFRAM